jgi:hypothetical protein
LNRLDRAALLLLVDMLLVDMLLVDMLLVDMLSVELSAIDVYSVGSNCVTFPCIDEIMLDILSMLDTAITLPFYSYFLFVLRPSVKGVMASAKLTVTPLSLKMGMVAMPIFNTVKGSKWSIRVISRYFRGSL